MHKSLPRLLLAAPASGQGKTTVTLALLKALQQRVGDPVAFKCGPDYIDPMFHRRVLGLPSFNLDLFLSDAPTVCRLLAENGARGKLSLIEGAMGFYDGVANTAQASAWHLAEVTQTPVVLVVSARGAALSLAALISGFAAFKTPSHIVGVILNRCAKPFYDRIAPALEAETGLPMLGFLPELPECALKSRHLGLVTAEEVVDLNARLDVLGQAAEAHIAIDRLLALAQNAPSVSFAPTEAVPTVNRSIIAVARDEAFCFYYDETFALFEKLGARLCFFSPLKDAALPKGASALYLGGGYPELYARRLSENTQLLQAVHQAILNGMPCIAECGGFLYLHEQLGDDNGTCYPMANIIPAQAKGGNRLGNFGYATLTARQDNLLCSAGGQLKVHEFHYWQSDAAGSSFKAEKPDGRIWDCAHTTQSLFAGFPHLYLQGNIPAAERFLTAAAAYGGPYGF